MKTKVRRAGRGRLGTGFELGFLLHRRRVESLEVNAPAKLNLFLAVTGRRRDGFHDLVSLAVPLDFGDTLRVEPSARTELNCDDPTVPADDSNLVLRAARAFSEATGWRETVRFNLIKRVPAGAGLGGGSSDAAATLLALNRLAGPARALGPDRLAEVAASIGSDCPLFLAGGPVVMRGRGERLSPLPAGAAARLGGRRVLVFKPGFPISTPWAYARLAAGAPGSYLPAAEAEARLATWIGDDRAPAEDLPFNSLEAPAFRKFPALPLLLPESTAAGALTARVRKAWGESAFVCEARIRRSA
jgi:4-diphosphocytidyl-2-C-methyl-D-erythritol kinase